MRPGPYTLVAAGWALAAAYGSWAAHQLLRDRYGLAPQAATTIVAAAALASAVAVVVVLSCREPWRSRAHVTAVTVGAGWALAAVADAAGALDPATLAAVVAVAVPAATALASASVLHLARLGARRQIQGHVTEHVLYRFYDVYERLLYIGITSDPRSRFGQHRASKDWWGDVAVRELTYLPSREALEEAERDAIRTEKPRHNKVRYEAGAR